MQMSATLDAKLKEISRIYGTDQFEAVGVIEAVQGLAEYLVLNGKGPIAVAIVMATVAGTLMKTEIDDKDAALELYDIFINRIREEMLK